MNRPSCLGTRELENPDIVPGQLVTQADKHVTSPSLNPNCWRERAQESTDMTQKRLTEKVALVTGGSNGIGRATCLRFAEEDATVVIADVDESAGQQLAEEINKMGTQALFVPTDVSSETSVSNLVKEAKEQFNTIDVLINNAATFVLRGIDASVDEWKHVLQVNVVGTALVTRSVVPLMKHSGGGSIVNLGSISSFIAQPEFVTYSATKAAISSMTRCLAEDLAKSHIRVNAVCPGTVWTGIVEELTRQQGLDRSTADAHPDWGGAHMLHRIADPREIANAILFLASDEASFITGENLMVDGGYTAR